MGIRRAASIVTVLLAGAAMAGCATPAPVPVPTPVVLARGEFQDAAGTASGLIEISKLPDVAAVAVFSGVAAEGTGLLLMMSEREIGPDESCLESGLPLIGPEYEPGLEDTYILQPLFDGPDELAAFVIARETGAETGCLVEIVAYANLEWTTND
jgi:hypothetical protein